MLSSILVVIMKNLKTSFLGLALFSTSIALFVHSQFVNSLFYPQILMPFIFLVGLKYVQDI